MTPDAETRESPTGLDLPPYLTVAEVGDLLRAPEFVRDGLPPDRRRRLIGAMSRRWLRAHGVHGVKVGKHLIYAREAVLEALTAAERRGAPA
jgi:hypothetical protein